MLILTCQKLISDKLDGLLGYISLRRKYITALVYSDEASVGPSEVSKYGKLVGNGKLICKCITYKVREFVLWWTYVIRMWIS